jgi:hypothetical protein
MLKASIYSATSWPTELLIALRRQFATGVGTEIVQSTSNVKQKEVATIGFLLPIF